LFVREGYESFSMRKLAQKVEYSPAGIYLHFKSKQDLFLALVDESFARLRDAQRRLDEKNRDCDPVELLKKGLRMYVQFGLDNPNDYRFAFLLNRPGGAPLRNNRPAFEHLRGRVSRCIEQKRLRAVDIETASQALWCAAHGVTSLLIQRPNFPWVSRKELMNQVIDSAVDSLAAEKNSGAKHADRHYPELAAV
ncbi:MAG: TetR/AcrR family transcriptional regulator, partial [Bryobacteraceae bacterium]